MTGTRTPEVVPGAVPMPAAARLLADDIDARAMAAAVMQRVATEVFPTRVDDEEFLAALGPSVTDNVEAVLDVIAGRLRIASAEPLGAIALMDVMAALGEPTSSVERGYRIGQWAIWEEWFRAATARAAGSDTALAELTEAPSRALFMYIDHVLGTVLHRYEEQRRELDRARDHERSQLLRQILDGTLGHVTQEMSAVLGYDTTLVHRALILKCEDRRRAQLAAAQLRDALGASDVLLHPERVHGWALWLGRRDEPTRVQLSRFRRAVHALGLAGGAGEPQAELAGFRRSHVQAREALRVSDALAEEAGGVVLYADVRLEAMLLADHARAREFVADELGPLAGDDERGARLRETVAAWLSTGSHVGAASLLDIHEHTVRNRLRQAEELCGTTLAARRTELAVALRLHRMLG